MNLIKEQLSQLKGLLKTQALSSFKGNAEGHLGGKKIRELEDLFCDYFNVRYAVSMNSATSCLHAACVACDVQGREVITTPVTFSASASCIHMAGGNIKFSDIDPHTYCLDPLKLNPTEFTKAIIPVHLHGHPADLTRIITRVHKARIIEDASQAIGATYKGRKAGTIGDCGIFSFNQSKQLNSGEGGMLITNDEHIAEVSRLIRNHGETQSDILGYNYRMTELHAAVLIPQFKRLDYNINVITQLCEQVSRILSNVEELSTPVVQPGCTHAYFTYPVKVTGIDRDRLQKELLEKGIYFGKGGYKPLYLFPYYSDLKTPCPVADDCYRTVMYTNIFRPPMKVKQAEKIAKTIKETVWRISHT